MCGIYDICSVGVMCVRDVCVYVNVVFIWYVACVSRVCYLWVGGI